ncbi:hypothetical protein [Streptomyces winkii]|uniref:hypothetical protein n=1 Tax=Streptomyces winkii TaxID=3051178 RepID=UPI0028D19E2E|nr:hypothetical protein [Streptomyces sp. DSM 40971]
MPRRSSEVLTEIRDQLCCINKTVRNLGDQLSRSIADTTTGANYQNRAVLADIEALRREIAEIRATPHAEPAPRASTSAAPDDDCRDHHDHHDYNDLLRRAAGTAYAELVCHRDTWAFLVEQASGGEHFHLPVDIETDDDGIVEVDISGRSLIAVIDALWRTRRTSTTPATSHLAAKIYNRIGDALGEVDRNAENGNAIRILIDDRRPRPRGGTGDTGGTGDAGDAGDKPCPSA